MIRNKIFEQPRTAPRLERCHHRAVSSAQDIDVDRAGQKRPHDPPVRCVVRPKHGKRIGMRALDERLQDDEAYDDVRGQPFREVVQRLCADIGLDPDWSDWTDEGWPEPDEFFKTRATWSPFNRVSRKRVLT